MKTSTAEKSNYRCPRCGDALARDLIGRGFVRHLSNPKCGFGRTERDEKRAKMRRSAGKHATKLLVAAAISGALFSCSPPTDRPASAETSREASPSPRVGPSEELTRDLVSANLATKELKDIEIGDALVATGSAGIPAGTVLYPVRVVANVTLVDKSLRWQPYSYYVYQDVFHKWTAQRTTDF